MANDDHQPPPGVTDDGELLRVIADAVEVSGGGTITTDQARQVRDRLTRGRNIPNPAKQLVNLITTMTEDELRHLVPGRNHTEPARDSLGTVPRPSPADRSPAARTVSEVMSAGRTGPPSTDQAGQAARAREALANRPKPEPEPPTDEEPAF